MANMGVIAALAGRGDTVLEDYLNHASLLDGGLLSRAKFQRYKHKNCIDLEAKLNASCRARKLVVTDGVFSMDGDMSPLKDLSSICKKYDAALMVDDAHGFGWPRDSALEIDRIFVAISMPRQLRHIRLPREECAVLLLPVNGKRSNR